MCGMSRWNKGLREVVLNSKDTHPNYWANVVN
jgi:hypothetical protein